MRVFKYLHPDRIDVLRNQSIRFTQSECLNDRFELRPVLSQLASPEKLDRNVDTAINKIICGSKFKKAFREKKLNPKYENNLKRLFNKPSSNSDKINYLKSIIADSWSPYKAIFTRQINTEENSQRFVDGLQSVGVLSLTKRNNNQLMWAHYADSHKGFVIEFDPSASFFRNPKSSLVELQTIQEVDYVIVRPQLRVFDYAYATKEDIDNLARSIFLTKSEVWKDEQELRLLKDLGKSDIEIEILGQKIHLFKFDPSIVLNIYLGSRISSEFEQFILNLLDEERYSHVSLYKESLEGIGYEITFKQVR